MCTGLSEPTMVGRTGASFFFQLNVFCVTMAGTAIKHWSMTVILCLWLHFCLLRFMCVSANYVFVARCLPLVRSVVMSLSVCSEAKCFSVTGAMEEP